MIRSPFANPFLSIDLRPQLFALGTGAFGYLSEVLEPHLPLLPQGGIFRSLLVEPPTLGTLFRTA